MTKPSTAEKPGKKTPKTELQVPPSPEAGKQAPAPAEAPEEKPATPVEEITQPTKQGALKIVEEAGEGEEKEPEKEEPKEEEPEPPTKPAIREIQEAAKAPPKAPETPLPSGKPSLIGKPQPERKGIFGKIWGFFKGLFGMK